MASLSKTFTTSACSSMEWVVRTLLYGSTTAVEIWGDGYTVKHSLLFLA